MFNWFHKKSIDDTTFVDVVDSIINNQANSLRETEAAIEKGIDLIAKMTAKAKFKVYRNNKEEKNHQFYLLNLKPNNNESAYHFWRRAVKKMLRKDECLIYVLNGKLFIADDFDKSEDICNSTIFTNVQTGDMSIRKVFKSNEVIWLKNTNTKSLSYMHSFENAYDEFLVTTLKAYNTSESKKYGITMPTVVGSAMNVKIKDAQTGKEVSKSEYINSILDKLASSETEAIMLGSGMTIDLLNGNTSKDPGAFLKIVNQIQELTASKFDIPIDVFLGKTTEKSNAMNDFITSTISIYAQIIEDALNVFFCSESEYLDGTHIKADLTSIKYASLVDNAVQLEKLFGIGFSHNDLREVMGMNPIKENWANAHFISKNNGTAEDVLKGGEVNGK